ncbi:MAG: hypothetical protein CMJ93_02785 [Planctomycetes bacterium]|nr:hypothetical protein [Planctomycetota bacterium]
MLSLRALTLLSCLMTSTLLAQTTYLSEDFTSGVPPAGWLDTKTPGSLGWHQSTFGGTRAWHEDESGFTCDSYLISPDIDLSTATTAYLHFAGETYYTAFMANHPSTLGDGVSTIEVTTDGGVNWTVIWTDTSTVDNTPYAPNLGLNAFIGSATVNIAMHYYGTYAHEWWVDYFIVDDTPVPTLATAINPNNGHPYALLGASDFAAAEAVAQDMGGHLVSITDLSENDWIRTQFGTVSGVSNDFWLGYNDVLSEGNFVWSNGEVTNYENWNTGEPNNSGNEDYVQMTSTGRWNDTTGSVMGHGVVEISEPSLAITPLVAGQLATFDTASFPADSRLAYVVSINGPGPSNTPFGLVLEVDLDIISPIFQDNNGSHSISTYIPGNLGGRTLYSQVVVFEPDGDITLSNPIAEPIN